MTGLMVLALGAAGGVGALLRYLAGVALPARRSIPWGVLIVNVVGSFLAGLGVAAIDDPAVGLAIVTGFCGGLTTFSTHAVDSMRLVRGEIGGADARRRPRGPLIRAAANVAATLVFSLAAVTAGLALGGGAPAG